MATRSGPEGQTPGRRRGTLAGILVGGPVGLVLAYLILSPVLSLFGIDLPQVIYTPRPREVALASPYHSGPAQAVRPQELQDILDAHPYDQAYEEGVFDCSDRSIITARLLQEEYGYDTSVVGDDIYGHAWVYVWVDENLAWAIETAGENAQLQGSAGEVVGDQWWDVVFQGRWLESKAWDLGVTGYSLYYPQEKREGLHVLEWWQVGEGR